jgi:hypothetical protein
MQSYIPYVVVDDDQNHIQTEHELALALLLALSREGRSEPRGLLKAHYPFRVYTVEGEEYVFDLLGFSESDKRLLLPKDVTEMLIECAKVESSEDKQVWLNTGVTVLEDEQDYATISVDGLIEHEKIVNYLLEVNGSDEVDVSLFEPLFTKKDFTALKKKLRKAQKEISERIESNEQTKKHLEKVNIVIQEEQEKKTATFIKESKKRLDLLFEEKENAFKNLDKTFKKDSKSIDNEIQESIDAQRLEYEKITQEIEDLEIKVTNGDRDAKRAVGSLNNTVRQITKKIQELENERTKRITELDAKVGAEKAAWEEKIHSKNLQEEEQEAKLVETHNKTLEACKKLLTKIEEVEKTLNEDHEKISKLLKIKYDKGDTKYLPFYLFKYEEDYGYYPPVKLSEESGVKKTLKLLFAGNLEQKMDQRIIPQTDAFNNLLEKLLNDLNEETDLSQQYNELETELNILESREILDKVEVGLYQIMEWQWISEKDYIAVQRYLVQQLDILNGGNIYTKQEEVVIDPIDPNDVTVAPQQAT